MAMLESLTIAELDSALANLTDRMQHAAGESRASLRVELRDTHELLIRAVPSSPRPPIGPLTTVRNALEHCPPRAVDALPPRSRTVFRLVRAGALSAAWEVLVDNSTGVVKEHHTVATSSGAPRTGWRLPLLTDIEPPAVYARLPGFRDPRFEAPDECYDIADLVKPSLRLDDAWCAGRQLVLGGSLSLAHLDTGPTEAVRLQLTQAEQVVAVDAERVRRSDLVRGTGVEASRLAWAGWSVALDVRDRRLGDGTWSLAVSVDHDGIRRTAPIGPDVGELAQRIAHELVSTWRRKVSLDVEAAGWQLVVA